MMRAAGTFTRFATLAPALALVLGACGASETTTTPQRYSKKALRTSLASADKPGLSLGTFALPHNAVVDGDTIRVKGLKATLRLIAIDSEETYKSKRKRLLAEGDFEQYLRDVRGDHRRPRKTGTPMGEEAKEWAQRFFDGVEEVRLERDHEKEIKGRFNRYLVYVFANKGDRWINYNVEHVRAGMSPYFTKYSYSRRFHDEFVQAENEARAAKRGIWNPDKMAYRDYDERKKWWDARAEFLKAYEEKARGRDDYLTLTHWDTMDRLGQLVDQEVTILGLVGAIRWNEETKRGPTRVMLSRRMFNDLAVIFWERGVFHKSEIARFKGEFVVVRGLVSVYHNKYRNRKELQLVVTTPSQVTGSIDVPGIPPAEPPKTAMEPR